ncbi:MAG TPA: hypothetical protein VM925_27175 [Labilithrix sp.]|nr:hypothetical protein [Labilithrix sp.]
MASFGLAGVCVVAFVACESSAPSSEPTSDAATEAQPVVDAGHDARELPDTASPTPACAAVKGPCDVVAQDCADDEEGQKQECVVASSSGGAVTTECVPVQPSQQLPMGRGCCPGRENPCLPGLQCVGDTCVDGGPITGRCTPACCPGDDSACGQSEPEGIGGQCDVTLFVGSTEVHQVCSYRERCKPFGIQPCKEGQVCIIEDKLGTAGCIASNNVENRQPCQFANDCKDGHVCSGPPNARVCRMFCLTPNSNPSFDASAADGAPGRGGCPSGETCTGPGVQGMPDWIQLCELPDGG